MLHARKESKKKKKKAQRYLTCSGSPESEVANRMWCIYSSIRTVQELLLAAGMFNLIL